MVRRLGIHIRTAGGLVKAARHAAGIGCNTFQIMSGNPSAWNPGELHPQQAREFRDFLQGNDLQPIFLHAGYLINLSCRTGRNAPLYAKSIKLLQDNIDRAAMLGCEFVVVHMGSHRGTCPEKALPAMAAGIGRLRAPDGPKKTVAAEVGGAAKTAKARSRVEEELKMPTPMLLLENSAGSGDTIGAGFEEIGAALAAVEENGPRLRLGVCLDTAHLWGAGYDISSKAAVDTMIEEFDCFVGLDRLRLIHFNDSPVVRGSKRDKHEHPGHGCIRLAGLRALARHPKLIPVPLIMETPGASEPSDEARMRDLKKLAGV